MLDAARTLDRIERALVSTPTCAACGAPTDIRDRDGRLWLECSTTPLGSPIGFRARLEAALAPHPRAIVLDPTDVAAA